MDGKGALWRRSLEYALLGRILSAVIKVASGELNELNEEVVSQCRVSAEGRGKDPTLF